MKIDKALRLTGLTSKSELSRKLGVSRQAVNSWNEVPQKWVPVIQAMVNAGESLEVKEPIPAPVKRQEYGSGSEYDGMYSRMKIDHIKGLLRQFESVEAVYKWIQPIQWDKQFIQDVADNRVAPRA